MQSFLAGLILHTKRKAGGGASSASSAAGAASPPSFTPEELAEVPEVTSLLFSLRPGGAQGGWRVHLSLMQEKPLYTPDSHEMDLFSEAERGMIKEAFNRYDEDGNGAIDQQELGLLLQDLGLQVRCLCVYVCSSVSAPLSTPLHPNTNQPPSSQPPYYPITQMQSLIVEEVQSRWTGSIGFEQFCSWWHQHRHILETWSSPFEFFSPASAPSPAPASAAAGGGSRPGIGAGDVGPKAAASPAAVPSPLAPSPAPTAATTAPGDLPPALAISSISPNIGHGGRLPSLSSPLAGSPASDKAPSPLSTMKHRAAKSTHALPPRSLTVDEEEIGEQDVFAMPDAIFRRWIDIELIFTHERFAAEARWIRGGCLFLILCCTERIG